MSSLANYISQIDLAGAADGDVLTYNSAEPSKFELVAPGALSAAVDDLTDVVITTVADGQVLTYDSGTSKWVNEAIPSPSLALDNLTDVVITTPSDGQVLTYDSGTSKFVNETPAASSGGGKLCLSRAVTSTGATGSPHAEADGPIAIPFGTVIYAATAEVEVTSNTLYTIKTAGNYLLMGEIGVDTSTSGNLRISIMINGVELKRVAQGFVYTNQTVHMYFHYAKAFSVNDTIEIKIVPVGGATIVVRGLASLLPDLVESSMTIIKEG